MISQLKRYQFHIIAPFAPKHSSLLTDNHQTAVIIISHNFTLKLALIVPPYPLSLPLQMSNC